MAGGGGSTGVRIVSALLDEIRKRLMAPEKYMPSASEEEPPLMSYQELQASAVATLFETAEPAADSKLREIDLPAELVEAARMLREEAEACVERGEQPAADRIGFLANVVQDVSNLIENPATMLMAIARDRDLWRAAYQSQAEILQLTEAGLGVSQASGLSLAEGQNELVSLLERVARADEGWRDWGQERPKSGAKVITRSTRTVDEVGWAETCEWKPAEVESLSAIMPEIKAVLNQVTVLEKDADGRLVVARQPEPEKEA